ncbi:glycoside hydrolase family 99-like domain-containing protein [Lacrimispora sp.]|uniref:glycoside hydrolase family 99-like domain-containing protein n=1 Tax=Lacrimispora sp. TaxID=2719234 RepID=UPI0028AB9ED2|nr:glycoside hydrolase family 99-like domain-containing protein [Lacrimispora sp.]
MKVIALYLPQFHKVPENEQWWGEGYTEWTAVKKAEKLYDGHYQPRIPLNNNYYDLMQKDTMKWQAYLMNKYDVYGMCFYHYYFEKGKKILEKPAENLLKWKDINMPFCFSWANETWARTWSKIQGKNSWNNLIERDCGNDDGILLRQNYGKKEDWEEHFNYLIPFFKDTRYIKINNRPVFIIYKPDTIPCLPQMMELWNQLARENEIENIYFVATNSEKDGFDAYFNQEANFSAVDFNEFVTDYDMICAKIIDNAKKYSNKHYYCGFTGYDDSPRRGVSGKVIENSTPEKFYKLMKRLFYLGDRAGNELTFVNAWNEWGEGMYLEPDEEYQYNYLEALKKAQSDFENISNEEKQKLNMLVDNKESNSIMTSDNLRLKKYSYLMRLFNKWLCIKENGDTLQTYFKENGYNRIAVYGLGMAGNHLITEMGKSNIDIIYGIDKQGDKFNFTFPVYTPDADMPEADIIVVSVIYDFDNIYINLKHKFSGPIVSLEEIVDCVGAREF